MKNKSYDEDLIEIFAKDNKLHRYEQLAGVVHKGKYYLVLIENHNEDEKFIYELSRIDNKENYLLIEDEEIISQVMKIYNDIFAL